MAQAAKASISKQTPSRQLDGSVRHARYLREQREVLLATPHGTEKSRRGRRDRVNPRVRRSA